MPSGDADKPKKQWQRWGLAIVAVLGAFGIFSAIGGNIVDEVFPGVSEELTGAGLVRVSVRPIDASDGFTMATRSREEIASRVGAVDDCSSLYEAASEAEAVEVGRSTRSLVFEGTTHRDVTIVDLRAEVVRRSAPMAGAQIKCSSAEGVAALGFSFDFDQPQPIAIRIGEGPEDEVPYFQNGNVIVLKKGEVQPVLIVSSVSRDYVAWNLAADLIIDGEEESVTIDDDGHPFELTGGDGDLRYEGYYEWQWFEAPARLRVASKPLG
ncbi:MAG: hypothetical protein QOE75_1744 [Solirubrobacterales bacterium]|jgi:hypothetical protein|nr:hypothetical protein [Solirubrobacterales bacterium]